MSTCDGPKSYKRTGCTNPPPCFRDVCDSSSKIVHKTVILTLRNPRFTLEVFTPQTQVFMETISVDSPTLRMSYRRWQLKGPMRVSRRLNLMSTWWSLQHNTHWLRRSRLTGSQSEAYIINLKFVGTWWGPATTLGVSTDTNWCSRDTVSSDSWLLIPTNISSTYHGRWEIQSEYVPTTPTL